MFIDFEPVDEGGATESAAERFEVGSGQWAAKCESRKSFQNISTRCNNLYVQNILGACVRGHKYGLNMDCALPLVLVERLVRVYPQSDLRLIQVTFAALVGIHQCWTLFRRLRNAVKGENNYNYFGSTAIHIQ
jgi:hypothetical protein